MTEVMVPSPKQVFRELLVVRLLVILWGGVSLIEVLSAENFWTSPSPKFGRAGICSRGTRALCEGKEVFGILESAPHCDVRAGGRGGLRLSSWK